MLEFILGVVVGILIEAFCIQFLLRRRRRVLRGPALTQAGQVYGLRRRPRESDPAFRARLRAHLTRPPRREPWDA